MHTVYLLQMMVALSWLNAAELPDPDQQTYRFAMSALTHICEAAGIMGTDETLYAGSNIPDQLRSLRWGWRDMTHAPHLWTINLFPVSRVAQFRMLELSSARQEYYLQLTQLYPRQTSYVLAMQEAEEAKEAWRYLHMATTPKMYTMMHRRWSLLQLKNIIGEDNFYRGNMP